MTATTDHYLGIDLHKRQAQVAVLDDEGEVVEEVRVANADLDEIAQKYAGSNAALEAGSNYFTIYDRLDEELDMTLANPAKADWLENQKQKNDRKASRTLHGSSGWTKCQKATSRQKNSGATARLRAVARS
jgi:transposase